MTKITWATTSWNPISGCTPISEGCLNCYAKVMARRLQAMGQKGYEKGFEPTLHSHKLEEPRSWKKPRTVFVCSMGDLFHESLGSIDIMLVLNAIARAPRKHTFLILTKRPKRMREVLKASVTWRCGPLENVWLGVTAENQKRWDERVPVLLSIPAAHRWVNIGPMLERIAVEKHVHALDWVALEGEAGPGARPMKVDWARDVMQQCDVVDVPFHLKQYWGFRPEKNPELDGRRYTAMPPF